MERNVNIDNKDVISCYKEYLSSESNNLAAKRKYLLSQLINGFEEYLNKTLTPSELLTLGLIYVENNKYEYKGSSNENRSKLSIILDRYIIENYINHEIVTNWDLKKVKSNNKLRYQLFKEWYQYGYIKAITRVKILRKIIRQNN
jgi:hypothetical protein